jgi:hypothetical protein
MVDCGFDVLFCVVNAYFYVFCCGFMGFFDCWSIIFSNWYFAWGVLMAKLKKSELTQWFKYEDVPVRYGVYEVNPSVKYPKTEFDPEAFYAYWNGKRWGWITDSVFGAYESRNTETGWEVGELPWRGIAGT